jgi:ferredoxin
LNPIYYFSGTGGSLAAARRICAALPEYSPVPIAAMRDEKRISVDADAMGLVFPLYYAGLPGIVADFLRKLEFKMPCYIFAAVSCGLPWTGYALHQSKWLLRKKGQELSAGFYVKMVDNYLPHFDMPLPEAQEPVYQNVKAKVDAIIECVRRREKKVEREKALLLYPTNPIYIPLLKRNDRFYTVDETCTSCGICRKVCPVNNIELKDGKPVWMHNCEFCLACIHYCPQKAIQWKDITQKKGRYHYKGISSKEIAKQKTL